MKDKRFISLFLLISSIAGAASWLVLKIGGWLPVFIQAPKAEWLFPIGFSFFAVGWFFFYHHYQTDNIKQLSANKQQAEEDNKTIEAHNAEVYEAIDMDYAHCSYGPNHGHLSKQLKTKREVPIVNYKGFYPLAVINLALWYFYWSWYLRAIF